MSFHVSRVKAFTLVPLGALAVLLAVLIAASPCLAGARWTANGVPVCDETGNQMTQCITTDGSGASIIAWQDDRDSGTTGVDIYVMKIGSDGTADPGWTAAGVPICAATGDQTIPRIVSDGAGGAIVTWQDQRGADQDIYAQKVDSAGTVAWTDNGVQVCGATNAQQYPVISTDASGGAVIVWQDFRGGTEWDVYAQRVLTGGTVDPAWTADGNVVSGVTAETGGTNELIVAPSGSGNTLAIWRDRRDAARPHPYAQKIGTDGTMAWAADGVQLCTADGPATFGQIAAYITSDGSGGAIAAWMDGRLGLGANDLFAQHVKSDGNIDTPNWAVDGNPLCTSTNDQYCPQVTPDGAGGAFAVWYDYRSGGNADIYAQRILDDGTIATGWDASGQALCTEAAEQDYPQITGDGSGTMIAVWMDQRNGAGTRDVYSQKIDSSAVVQWPADGAPICKSQITGGIWPDTVIASDGSGGAVYAFSDNRNPDRDVFAQRFDDGPGITGITPNAGLNTGTVSITDLAGSNFISPLVKLKKTGQADIDATSVVVSGEGTQITCDFDLTGAQLGQWGVYVENSGGLNATLTNGFTVTAPAPTVFSITPDKGDNNGAVSITDLAGTGFRTGATVKLQKSGQPDIDATGVIVNSDTTIVCDFDLTGATTGLWDVVVTNDDLQSATLTNGFTIEYPAPTVSGITPDSGVNTGTVSITDLAGTGFRTGAAVTLQKSGQPDIVGTSVEVSSSTRITCDFGLTGAQAGAWDVVVTNDDAKTGTGTGIFTVNNPAPTISSITPSSGVTGTSVSITDLAGTNFYGAPTVLLKKTGQTDITATSVLVVSPAQITCDFDLTGAAAGDWDVYVQNPDGQHATRTNGFHVNYPSAPNPTSMTPNNGTNDGPVSITDLAGTGFRTGATVKLSKAGNDINATSVQVPTTTKITCTFDLTGASVGSWDLTVTNNDGQSGTLNAAFTITYPAPPNVVSVDPDTGGNDGQMFITNIAGTGFQEGASVVLTRTGQTDITATSVLVISPAQIGCSVDLTGAQLGKWNVTVKNDDSQEDTLADAFTVQFPGPPAPTGITPAEGVNDGIINITGLAGYGFQDGAVVKLQKAGKPDIIASSVVVGGGGTTITCIFDLSGEPGGSRDVYVENIDAQSGVLQDGFNVKYPSAPTITDIVPDNHANNATISPVINGSDFHDGAIAKLKKAGQPDVTATNVTVDGPGTQVQGDFDIDGVTPGDWDVYVENDDGQSDTLAAAFHINYPNAPTVDSVAPPQAGNGGTAHLTVSGRDFHFAATVTLKRTGQTDIVAYNLVIDPGGLQITCDVDLPGALVGDWDLVVENIDGQTGQGTLHVNFPQAPSVTAITPGAGTNDGVTSITNLAGSGFQPGASVTLTRTGQPDIVAANVVVAPDSHHITCDVDLTGVVVGDWNMVVENTDGQTGHRTFHVNYPAAPAVTTVAPSRGANNGVTNITDFAGSGFQAGATVRLRRTGQPDIAATNIVVAVTRITCDVDLTGAVVGNRNVVVTNDDSQSSTLVNGFFVSYPNPPAVTAITPNSATNSGTTAITNLVGTGFKHGASVKLSRTGQPDINATNVVVVSATKITCDLNLSGAAEGAWDVWVTNNDGQGASKKSAFSISANNSTWYLAEGTSDYGFDTYVTIENPNNTAVTARVTYMTSSGPRSRPDVPLPAMSQTVINPRNDIGATDFSTKVQCVEGKSIAVDRRMTWQGPGAPSPEGHCSIGVTAPARTWYLAEGSSKWGFETWLLIQNPNTSDASVTVTYMIEGRGPVLAQKTVPASSRASFNMETDIGQADASIKVQANVPVIPERAMYRYNRREGHDSIGTTTPDKDYYLAEGTTDWGFTTYVLVQNPNSSSVGVNITYMTPAGPVSQPSFQMDANSRKTVNVNTVVPAKDLSIHVNGTLPIIAERAMYWGAGTAMGEACHDSIGMDTPHMTFYLPDGETYNGTETWTLVQNPNSRPVSVQVSYLTVDGKGNVVFTEAIPANSRKSFNMGDKLPASRASVMVKSQDAGRPIMVERSMYWNSRGAGTDTIGGFSD